MEGYTTDALEKEQNFQAKICSKKKNEENKKHYKEPLALYI